MAIIIDGKKIAAEIRSEIKSKVEELSVTTSVRPGLALILVGDDPASHIYVRSKAKACEELGFYSIVERFPEDTPEIKILEMIDNFNNDPKIHGILVQLPLPKHINELKVILSVNPAKDVDGLHPENMGRLVVGLPGFVSCTPAGIFELLKRYDISVKGKHVVVVGRSNIVGKPIANLLYQKNKDANGIVTICHTAASDLKYYTKQADILIAAMGVPQLITSGYVKEGVTIIDVGTNRVPDNSEKGYKLVGDVDFNSVEPKAFAISPVPGGVGPMTIAMLLQNTFKSAYNNWYV
jgi:methylenetetrahydrofolate dehydrogenase (NADP+) / methenyltetrahydrofolate cyclohydrolase